MGVLGNERSTGTWKGDQDMLNELGCRSDAPRGKQ